MATPSTSRRRALLAAVPHPIAAIPTITLLLAAADRLPDPLASHFDLSGTADGFASRWVLAALAAGIGISMAVVFALIAGSGMGSISRRDVGRWLIGLSWGTAGFLGTVEFAATAANLDLADPAAAVLPGWTFPVALLIAVGAGLLGALVTPPAAPSTPDDPAVPVPLGSTERVSWSRTTGSPVVLVVAGVVAAAGIALWVAGLVLAGIVMVVAGALALVLGSARVTVDRRGLTVALGMLGWPRLRVPADDVESVTVADVSPIQYGGWGYRVLPGASGVILRSGEALVVTRRSGRRFAVTVDDAGTGAGLLAGIAARN